MKVVGLKEDVAGAAGGVGWGGGGGRGGRREAVKEERELEEES